MWKDNLKDVNEKAAEALADPERYPNLFPDLEWALKVENLFKANRHSHIAASKYPSAKADLDLDLIGIVKQQAMMQTKQAEEAAEAAEAAVAAMASKEEPVVEEVEAVEVEAVVEAVAVCIKSMEMETWPTRAPSLLPRARIKHKLRNGGK